MSEPSGEIKRQDQYEDTPEGWQRYWAAEMKAAETSLDKFHQDGRKVIRWFLDLRDDNDPKGSSHLNLFTANVQTLKALLFGKVPQVEARRRYGDPNDKKGRAAADILARVLNTDIDRNHDSFKEALKNSLLDRLLPGLGFLRMRYTVDTETVPGRAAITKDVPCPDCSLSPEPAKDCPQCEGSGTAQNEIEPAVPESERKTDENVEAIYENWEDVRWSPCRVWDEMRFAAFKAKMTQEQIEKRFAEKWKERGSTLAISQIPLNAKDSDEARDNESLLKPDPWSRAEVWEIWDKERKKVWWWVKGAPEILDSQDDPLGLKGFWPFPKPLMANLTTSAMIPRADFILAQDSYREINDLSGRIAKLERAIRVVGAYNGANPEIGRMVEELGENQMLPVAEWASWAAAGGVKGNVDWFPIDMIVLALEKLREQLQLKISLSYQVTGMSDIMRGQAQGAAATATEQAIKAKFASVRVQEFQDEFARFATDAMQIKAEIIARFYDPERIAEQANVAYMPDADIAEGAIALLKDNFWQYRVEVKPDSISLPDYAAMKQERVEIMQAFGNFIMPMMQAGQAAPPLVPVFMQMLRWMFSGFKGATVVEIGLEQAETMLGQMIQQQASQPPKQDPAVEREQIKGQVAQQQARLDMQVAQGKHKIEMQKLQQQEHHARTEIQIDRERMQHEQQRHVQDMTMQAEEAALRRAGVTSAPNDQPGAQEKPQ